MINRRSSLRSVVNLWCSKFIPVQILLPFQSLSFDSLPNEPKLHPSKIALFSPGGKLQCAGQFTTAATHFIK